MSTTPPPRITSPAMQRRVIALLMGAVLVLMLIAAYSLTAGREPQRSPEALGALQPVQVGPYQLAVPQDWQQSQSLRDQRYDWPDALVYRSPEDEDRHLAMIPLYSPQRLTVGPLLHAMRQQLVPTPIHDRIPLTAIDPRHPGQWQWAEWGGVRQADDGVYELHLIAVLGWRGRQFVLIYYHDRVQDPEQVDAWVHWNHQLLHRIRQNARLQF